MRTLAEVAPPGRYERIVALTGAGISAAAGLGTFRGPGGLWLVAPELEEAMHARYVPGNVGLMWELWGGIRRVAAAAGPTPAHRALARAGVTVITQNIDGLHQDAGSTGVVEVHGSAARAACLSARCGWRGASPHPPPGVVPTCPDCGGTLRPDLVLFGEPLDPEVWQSAAELATTCDLMLAVGTSAWVTPAKWLVPLARDAGAYCVNVNTDGSVPFDDPFHEHVVGDCQETLPTWCPE